MPDLRVGMPTKVERFVRSLDGVYYLRGEVARALGVDERRVRDMGPVGSELGPSFSAMCGQILIYLYTEDDLEALRAYHQSLQYRPDGSKRRRRGAPVMWSDEDRVRRGRLRQKARHLRREIARARAAEAEGGEVDLDLIAQLAGRVQVLREQLDSEFADRRAVVSRPRIAD